MILLSLVGSLSTDSTARSRSVVHKSDYTMLRARRANFESEATNPPLLGLARVDLVLSNTPQIIGPNSISSVLYFLPEPK
uniref:Uncharacterized protein n=1 Tax=Nelumbo nucifera TaxID=4432 RepID=A0A822ZFA7_NELNU|nr:TPA_asm: hypothetical protein HUJ06_001430 [Nelumbo nucifera]